MTTSFSLADFLKDAIIIEQEPIPAIEEAQQRMDELAAQQSSIPAEELPDPILFQPFYGNKAYIIRPEEDITGGTAYLNMQAGRASYLMLNNCNQIEEIAPANGTDFKLAQVYTVTGSPIDIVYELPGLTGTTHIMLLNDEGWLFDDAKHNMMASLLAGRPIPGTVIICPDKMFG
jgi:hypothetical protein